MNLQILEDQYKQLRRIHYLLTPWSRVLCDKWVPVTTTWRVLRLRMEERSPIWRIAANKINKQS